MRRTPKVKTRLDVAQRMIEDDIYFTEGIQPEMTSNRDIVKEIGQHFSEPIVADSKRLAERGSVRRVETR